MGASGRHRRTRRQIPLWAGGLLCMAGGGVAAVLLLGAPLVAAGLAVAGVGLWWVRRHGLRRVTATPSGGHHYSKRKS